MAKFVFNLKNTGNVRIR